ncbi:hypothetical protein DE146DRAFT_627715 [Phaeosphaeria sp. MPI-PUGE-AT-0046c]|nr:hypothetical protein DE146DRAFT_627715 [Phaeosphaeria sp. MPI-PUGE-AT-0046c]
MQRNHWICTYTYGRTTPHTKEACNKCLDRQTPCGRLIAHPSGTGFAIGFVPVPATHHPVATTWTDLAFWARQVEDWQKLATKPLLVVKQPASGSAARSDDGLRAGRNST